MAGQNVHGENPLQNLVRLILSLRIQLVNQCSSRGSMRFPFWSKSNYRSANPPTAFLPGHDHPRDAAMVASVLLAEGRAWRDALERMLGKEAVFGAIPALLLAIGMHDVAKFALNFASMADTALRRAVIEAMAEAKMATAVSAAGRMTSREQHLKRICGDARAPRAERRGTIHEHHSATSSFLSTSGAACWSRNKSHPLADVIRDVLLRPGSEGGRDGFRRLMAAVGAHHGGPVEPTPFQASLWTPPPGFEQWDSVPASGQCVRLLIADHGLDASEVEAGFEVVGTWPAVAVNMIAGITVACDWLASDDRHFPLERSAAFDRHAAAINAAAMIAQGRAAPEPADPSGLPVRLRDLARRAPGRLGKFAD
ncbi:MAG: hypothetical protein HQL38_20195, partial [Alphaproteobacteria bacterium]|nr:hypothetical protein [Alphaproteobacteria bacterium]